MRWLDSVLAARLVLALLALAPAACASNGGTDAAMCPDWVVYGCWTPTTPPTPAHFTPPTVACGDVDAGVADPCAQWVDCVGSDADPSLPQAAWAVSWSGGSCVSGSCVFTTEPTAQYCYIGCWLHTGPYGRCTHVGSTAP